MCCPAFEAESDSYAALYCSGVVCSECAACSDPSVAVLACGVETGLFRITGLFRVSSNGGHAGLS